MIYPIKTSAFIKLMMPSALWHYDRGQPHVYLTFDDGPHPDITPWVLDILQQNEVKATFFCIGQNVKKYPEIYQQILDQGHSVGNHTFTHKSGWAVNKSSYLQDVALASELINSNLFRPPYGKLKLGQTSQIKSTHRIIMWDVLSGDFDLTMKPISVFNNVTKSVKNGSIIVMHDSEKAASNVKGSLQDIISYLQYKGLLFMPIPYESIHHYEELV